MSDEIPEPAPAESPLSLGQVFDAITPPGTNGADLLAALNASRRPALSMRDVLRQEVLMDEPTRCYFPSADPAAAPEARSRASGTFPADPFTRGAEASAALREFYLDLLGADFTEDEATSIIGKMLAETYGGREAR